MSSNSRGPEYYRRGKIQVWDFIRDQGLNFHLGNAVKYICRAGYKDSRIEDLKKAIHYLENELEHANALVEGEGEHLRSVDVRCDGVSTTFPVPIWTVAPVFETASDSHY